MVGACKAQDRAELPVIASRLVSVAKRSLSFKIADFSQFFLLHFLDMSVCLWTHV